MSCVLLTLGFYTPALSTLFCSHQAAFPMNTSSTLQECLPQPDPDSMPFPQTPRKVPSASSTLCKCHLSHHDA
jgi:hypothetical protein